MDISGASVEGEAIENSKVSRSKESQVRQGLLYGSNAGSIMFYFQFKELCWLLNSVEAEIQEFFTIPLGLSIIYANALELLLHFSFSLSLALSLFLFVHLKGYS